MPGIQRVIKEWPLAKQGCDNRQVVWTQDREQYNRDSREHQGATLSGVITVTDLYDPAVRAAKCIKVRNMDPADMKIIDTVGPTDIYQLYNENKRPHPSQAPMQHLEKAAKKTSNSQR